MPDKKSDITSELDFTALSEFLVFGFILGDRTMIKGIHLPQYSIPKVTFRQNTCMADYYSALKSAVDKALSAEPKCAITVTGGQDSRILAGIVAELGFDIPAFTFYSAFESKIAARVCAKLGLKHYFSPIGYDLDYEFLEKTTKVIGELYGTKDLISTFMDLKIQHEMNKHGVKALLHGGRANEILGSVLYSQRDIKNYFEKRADHSMDVWYKTSAYRSFLDYTSGMNIDEVFLEATVKSTLTRNTSLSHDLPNLKLPFIDSNVISVLYGLPYSERLPGIFQQKVLRKYFPDLNNIPTTTNFAPNFPNIINTGIIKAVKLFERFQRSRGRDRAIYTFSVPYFFERNRQLLLSKLEKTTIPQNRLQPLVHNALKILNKERIYQGRFLRRILTYFILLETIV